MISLLLNINAPARAKFLIAIGYVVALLAAIILHELGHGFAAYISGDYTAKMRGRLSLNPIKHLDPIGTLMMVIVGFGWAKPVPIDPRNFKDYKKGMLLTSLAGVLVNLLLAFISAGVMALFLLCVKDLNWNIVYNGEYSAGNYVYTFVTYLCMFSMLFNLSLMAFNILPIFPLDGFRVVETLAKPNNKYVDFMYKYGQFVLFGLLILSSVLGRINSNLDIFSLYINTIRNAMLKLFELIFHISIF